MDIDVEPADPEKGMTSGTGSTRALFECDAAIDVDDFASFFP